MATCVAAHLVLELTLEGLRGQHGQLLPVPGLEQTSNFGARLGNVFRFQHAWSSPAIAGRFHASSAVGAVAGSP